MNIRPALVLIENERILTMRYHYGNADVYNLPGGNVDFGESMSQTLVREMQEELNIEVSVGELLFLGEVHLPEKNKQTLHAIFVGKILKGIPQLNPQETTALEICWINMNDLMNLNFYPNVAKHILNPPENKYLGQIEQKWW